MVVQLLHEHGQDNKIWACDYESTIISVGPFMEHALEKGIVISTSHYRTGKNDTRLPVHSRIIFQGIVDKQGLIDHYSDNGTSAWDFDLEVELKALKLSLGSEFTTRVSILGKAVDVLARSSTPLILPETWQRRIIKTHYTEFGEGSSRR